MSSAILRKKFGRRGYEALSRHTIQEIKHSDALAVWTLLMSMPEGWEIRKGWVRKKLGIGDDRYKHGTGRLRSLGLWETVRIRKPDGKLGGSEVNLYDEIRTPPEAPLSRSQDKVDVRKTEGSESTHPYKNKHVKKEKIQINSAPPTQEENLTRQQESEVRSELEKVIGVEFPIAVAKLGDANRVALIIFKAKLTTEQARVTFAEFSACCVRNSVEDPWALLITLVRKAASANLRLSKEGEARMPPFV